MRLSALTALGPRLLDFSASDDVQEMQVGTTLAATGTDFDSTANVANWGNAELIYARNASVAILPGTIVVMDKNFEVVATSASEANSGRPIYVAVTYFAAGSTTPQYGWIMSRGVCPVRFSVAATVGRIFGGTAGVATPTAAAGVQILNARTLVAAVSAFTRLATTRTGSSKVRFSSVAGMYPGQAISGTGIPASSVISSIDPGGTSVVIGSAVGTPVAATTSASVTATMTNTGYGIVKITNAFFQGQIT